MKAIREVICEKLIEFAKEDKDICIVTSDSRGSASLVPFVEKFPRQSIEIGIAEQNLVGMAAGLAANGMKPYVASPACFLTMRAIEQIKIDVAYSNTNVKLIGISAGVSYGALGMTHHALQDIAVLQAIPNMSIVVPADVYETKHMMEALKSYDKPTYIRVGRSPVEGVYPNYNITYEIGKANILVSGDDVSIIAYGEMVKVAIDATTILKEQGVQARVINMHTIKPLDTHCIISASKETGAIIVLEEHSIHGGLGATISQLVTKNNPCLVETIAFPDVVLVAGSAKELFHHYGLTKENVAKKAMQLIERKESLCHIY
jgi:transketolase